MTLERRRRDRRLRAGRGGRPRAGDDLAVSTRSMNSGPASGTRQTYDRVSDPQYEWGLEVLDRLELGGGRDRARRRLRLGPGHRDADRAPARGRLIAVDGSAAMIEGGRERCARVTRSACRPDLLELSLELCRARARGRRRLLDARSSTGSSTTTRLFERLRAALRPGGRLVAQCGGDGNIADSRRARSWRLRRSPTFASHFEGIAEIWNFAAPGGDRGAPARAPASRRCAAGSRTSPCSPRTRRRSPRP